MPATLKCQSTDMVLVHKVFRRELGLLPAMMRAESPGSTARIIAGSRPSSRRNTLCTKTMSVLWHFRVAGIDQPPVGPGSAGRTGEGGAAGDAQSEYPLGTAVLKRAWC